MDPDALLSLAVFVVATMPVLLKTLKARRHAGSVDSST
jgi:hypothetical protein